MALIKCPKCGESVSSKAEECVACGAKLNTTSSANEKTMIEENVNFFLKWASASKVVFIILASIVVISSLVLAEDTDGLSLFLLIISALLVFIGIIIERSLQWKALTLKCLYNIDIKTK